MKIYIKDENIAEELSLLRHIKRILYEKDGENKEDLAPEILTIIDIINQIEYEQTSKDVSGG